MEPSVIYLVHLATSDSTGRCTWLLPTSYIRMEFDLCLSQKIHTKMVRLISIIQKKTFYYRQKRSASHKWG